MQISGNTNHMNLLNLHIIIKVIFLIDLTRDQDNKVSYKCYIYLRKLEFTWL